MSAKITSRDRGWDEIMRLARDISAHPPHVAIGVIGSKAAASREEVGTNAQLAAIHEYGSPENKIPQRSFIGATIDINRRRYQTALGLIGNAVVSGQRSALNAGLNRLGLRVRGDIQKRIADGIDPPNSPVTIERKGSSKPLIDSGQLRGSVDYEVRS